MTLSSPKNQLQELCHKYDISLPKYLTQPNKPNGFVSSVEVNNEVYFCKDVFPTKKGAEMNVAAYVLSLNVFNKLEPEVTSQVVILVDFDSCPSVAPYKKYKDAKHIFIFKNKRNDATPPENSNITTVIMPTSRNSADIAFAYYAGMYCNKYKNYEWILVSNDGFTEATKVLLESSGVTAVTIKLRNEWV